MRRSEINALIRDAQACFEGHGWVLPPNPRWDVTDFGLGNWREFGLVLVNLAEEAEYCEKVMYAKSGMATPAHCHLKKKEDITARWGELKVILWPGHPFRQGADAAEVKLNGASRTIVGREAFVLTAGERITLPPGVYHEFAPSTPECIIGEVSTANDDLHDNYFVNPEVGRFPDIVEDEEPLLHLIGDTE